MKIINTFFNEQVKLYQGNRLGDHRGYFERVFCQENLKNFDIKQSNISFTEKLHSFRGFHFQHPPNSEGKIIRCLKGSIIDFAVDLRKNSNTFMQVESFELSEENSHFVHIPKGFAHGFQSTSENVLMLYFHDEFYSPEDEDRINYKDPRLEFKPPFEIQDLSKKDSDAPFKGNDFQGLDI